MRMLKSIIFAAAALVAFASCQKELKFDDTGISSGAFKKDASGDCSPITVNGIFKKDSVLTVANFVDVQVNVVYPGTFNIKSDSVNGYSFSKTGSVVLGLNTIRLYPTGKPLAAGTNIFTITYGTSTCTFAITVPGPGVVPAVFTLSGAPAACVNATVGGVYTVNTTLASSNTLTIEVDVTTTGTYVIAAAPVPANGFAFTGSGTFTSPGKQLVTLTGTGTPQRAEISAVSVTNISNTCTIPVTVQPAAPPAVFTLDGAPNGCTSFAVAGTYMAGTVTSASNTVTLNVNVTTTGTYAIATNTLNGITFSKTGTFTVTGAQTIVLTASGTLGVAGTFIFKPNVTTTCDFSIIVQPPAPPAQFTLSGAPGACAPILVNGTYTANTVLGISNTAKVQVNVATTGSYTLTTATVNGMTFSKSGTFTVTGLQDVILQGNGTPITAGVSTLTPQIGTSSCTFPVTVVAAPTGIYTCVIDGVPTSFNDRAVASIDDSGTPWLFLDGFSAPPNGNFVPEFQIFIEKNDGSAITPGTYDENNFLIANGGYRIEIDYKAENPDLSVTIWNTSSNFFPPPHPPFKITVTSISATRVKGTFSGTLTNTLQGSTLFKVITSGVFDLPVQ
jgi:hypothetical protein